MLSVGGITSRTTRVHEWIWIFTFMATNQTLHPQNFRIIGSIITRRIIIECFLCLFPILFFPTHAISPLVFNSFHQIIQQFLKTICTIIMRFINNQTTIILTIKKTIGIQPWFKIGYTTAYFAWLLKVNLFHYNNPLSKRLFILYHFISTSFETKNRS